MWTFLQREVSMGSQERQALRRTFGIDGRSMALFRVGLALVLIADIVIRFRDLAAHYSDAGIFPRAAATLFKPATSIATYEHVPFYFSIFSLSGHPSFTAVLFVSMLLLAALLLLGYRTRVVTVALWLLVTSLHVRNPMILDRGDETLRLLLFWSMFIPLGASWSLDRALATNRRFVRPRITTWGTAGLLLQVATIYLFTWLLKTGAAWRDGTAVEMALGIERFATPAGRALASLPEALVGLTHGVFWFELAAPLLLFLPLRTAILRTVTVALLALMHVGFALTLKLGVFPFVSIVALIPYLPPEAWNKWQALRHGGRQLVIYYDGGCSFCRKMVHLLTSILVLPKARVEEAQSDATVLEVMLRENTWVVFDAAGVRHTHGGGLIALVRSSPLFRPLSWVLLFPPNAATLNAVYRWVARNRPGAVQAARMLPYRALGYRESAVTRLLAAVALLFIIAWNIGDLRGYTAPLRPIANALQIQQRWSMFAPTPPTTTGWFVMTGDLGDGFAVDLVPVLHGADAGPASSEKPAWVSRMFPSYRWDKYLAHFELGATPVAQFLGGYLCRAWESTAADSAPRAVEVIFLREQIGRGRGDGAPTRVEILEFQCDSQTAASHQSALGL